MKFLRADYLVHLRTIIFLLIPWPSPTSCIRTDLYLNKDKFGEFLRMDISEKGCTNVPLNWDNQAISLDTHGSCVKFYDLPYCRGKYVALQPYHGTFQDNLDTIGFRQLISSASPCGPKVPTGRYYILNGADGSVLTVEKKDSSVVAKTMPFKPYITKNQQFQIDKISLADYEIIPRVHEDLNPLTFDMSLSSKQHPVKRTWKIESVYRGKYVIKNEWNNRCLYKSESGKVDEHECVAWSPNQEWMFKSIKVQPFFPTKQELNQKPIRPDEKFPFTPQQELPVFPTYYPYPPQQSIRPGMPLKPIPQKPEKKKKKPSSDSDSDEDEENDDDNEDKNDDDKENDDKDNDDKETEKDNDPEDEDEEEQQSEEQKAPTLNKPHTRPNPIVINPKEPFPPVQPNPIYPKGTILLPAIGADGKPDHSKPPVPHVRHPGGPPFPVTPTVTDPRKPLWPPTLFGSFGPTPPTTTTAAPKKKDSDEEEEEEDDKEENEKEEGEEKEDDNDSKEEATGEDDQSREESNENEREEDDQPGGGREPPEGPPPPPQQPPNPDHYPYQ